MYCLTIVINYGLTFSKLSLFRNALLQSQIHILAKFNDPQQVLFTTVPNQFRVNGFFLFCFVCLVVVFLIPCHFVPRGRGI